MAEKVVYKVSSPVNNESLNQLFNAAWENHRETDFRSILDHSLAYICAFDRVKLIGFVNLAWDGGIHAFLLDTTAR